MKPMRGTLGVLIGSAILTLIGCTDRGAVAPDVGTINAAANATNGERGLLPCRPVAYDSATVRIGTRGGSIRVGRHVLTIPPYALTGSVKITAIAPSDTVNRLEFRPEGLVFRFPATLTMSYANCAASSLSKGIAYTTDSLVILEYLRARDDAAGKKVTGGVSHFSSYAVSW